MKNIPITEKLNKVIWVALLEQKKIVEATNKFHSYKENLERLAKFNLSLKKEVNSEIKSSEKIFYEKILSLSDDYFNEEDYANAAIGYSECFKNAYKDFKYVQNFIISLEHLKQSDLASEIMSYFEKTFKNNPEIFKAIADVHFNNKDYSKAVYYLEKYKSEKNSKITADDYNLLGCYYHLFFLEESYKNEDIEKSFEYFKTAYNLSPDTKLFAKNCGIIARKINKFQDGKLCWKTMLEKDDLTFDEKFDYACFSLKAGDFENWYKYFDFRFQKENNATQFPKNIEKPKWTGEDLSDSTLLVYFEQGFGDTFLFYGYLPRLTKMAKHIKFVVQNSIVPLLENNPYGIEVIPEFKVKNNINDIDFDYYIPSMSVPIVLKLDKSNISVGEGYLKAPLDRIEKYKEKYFNNDKLKIGISLSGNKNGDKTRDMQPKYIAELDNLKNVEIYCLNKDINEDDFADFKNNKVVNIAKDFNNFADTAAAIENCDVILTTDNCILNLAGGLGKKTYALFNTQYNFRWFDLSGDNVVWLTSVKPFINKNYNDWQPTIKSIIQQDSQLSAHLKKD